MSTNGTSTVESVTATGTSTLKFSFNMALIHYIKCNSLKQAHDGWDPNILSIYIILNEDSNVNLVLDKIWIFLI